jgi:hypothetical protein
LTSLENVFGAVSLPRDATTLRDKIRRRLTEKICLLRPVRIS